MKSLILSTCLFFLSTPLFSQTVAVAENSAPAVEKPARTTEATSAATIAAHNKMAFTQIGEHLQEHLGYPEEMTELALEGTVTAAVIISNKGKIAKVSVAKADLPEAFHQELLSCLKKLKKLELTGGQYFGKSVLYVPVHFSL